jgi:hypothetical protein
MHAFEEEEDACHDSRVMSASACHSQRGREREKVCVCVCVRERERERERDVYVHACALTHALSLKRSHACALTHALSLKRSHDVQVCVHKHKHHIHMKVEHTRRMPEHPMPGT